MGQSSAIEHVPQSTALPTIHKRHAEDVDYEIIEDDSKMLDLGDQNVTLQTPAASQERQKMFELLQEQTIYARNAANNLEALKAEMKELKKVADDALTSVFATSSKLNEPWGEMRRVETRYDPDTDLVYYIDPASGEVLQKLAPTKYHRERIAHIKAATKAD